ncbi:ATP-binding cassette domain-containing protein [Candidatus Micrarchaeota archaeon]|nr:ATP-binding cassette domain-containing protein [Candidatus Micrarchaeota archaeon]MBD3417472.1 ATP-binding cassette domain-containing protein [Candidatus Micrarchaeota archaeon]
MISLKNFSLSFKDRQVLRGLDFAIGKGEALGISGSMGSGKTSLLYCMKGIIPHLKKGKVSGKLQVNGMEKNKLRRDVGIVFQDPNDQIFSKSVYDEVRFGLKNHGFRSPILEEKIEGALNMVGLWSRREDDPFELSHGQRQKLAIASVLAMEPDLILLDEPTASMDHRTTLEVYKTLGELRESGKTIVAVEHDTDSLVSFADKFLILDHGLQKAFGDEDVFSLPEVAEAGVKIPWGLKEKQG